MTPQDAQPSRHVTTLVTRKSTLAMAWHHVCLEICKHMADTVLVVDDELELVAGCERLLQRLGHVSLRAHTGPEAMALIDRKKPDLVVADLRLPGADGLAVTRHARAHVPPIPVILITAYDSWEARRAASESGVDVYLANPFSNAAFLDAVARVLPPKSVNGLGTDRP